MFLAGILSLISFSSCVEKENDSPEALLIGKWYMTQTNTNPSYDGMHRDSYMEFTDTGVVKIVFESSLLSEQTYVFSGDKLTMTNSKGSEVYSVQTLTKYDLVLIDKNNETLRYKKPRPEDLVPIKK